MVRIYNASKNSDLRNQIQLQKLAFDEYRKQPSRGQLEVALLKKDVENIKLEMKDLQYRNKKWYLLQPY